MAAVDDELVNDLIVALTSDPGIMRKGWNDLALVCQTGEGMMGLGGFCYFADGSYAPIAPEKVDALDALEALRQALAEEDQQEPWVAGLIRISKEAGEIYAEFEYEDPARWAITEDTFEARAEELRPAPEGAKKAKRSGKKAAARKSAPAKRKAATKKGASAKRKAGAKNGTPKKTAGAKKKSGAKKTPANAKKKSGARKGRR